MGGFRDTFTKDDEKDLLGYDDTAFYYFAATVLLAFVLPWTFSVIYNIIFPGSAQVEKEFPAKSRAGSTYRYCKNQNMVAKVDEARKRATRMSQGSFCLWLLKMLVLVGAWSLIVLAYTSLGNDKEISRFDPFEILEVSSSDSAADIKKAYRKLSLVYHPDKNPDDPLAASRFIQITKAYQALTDETAKANYEKYGNPEGPQTSKVGIGLPKFLLEKENHLMILCVFFFIFLFIVPMTFICYYQKTKNYAANGVLIETLQFLGYYINESTRVKNCPELLAASAESRGMELRSTDNVQMKALSQQVVEHKKRQFNLPVITKNGYLIWAHMQRLHHLMTPELRSDLDELLRYSMKITAAMVEIACMREWFFTAQAMIEFRRCLVQALDVKASPLLQIPYFTEESLKHCSRGKNQVSSLHDFLSKGTEQRKGLANMEPQQLADIEAFASHVGEIELKATVDVEDEADIVVGDVATVTVAICRKNLKEGEAMGPVHAPLFPEPKFEEWWLFLVEAAPSTRIISFEKLKDTERITEEKMRFQVSRPGKYNMVLHAVCDSYAGLDQKVELNFTALSEDEAQREIIVHKEDEDLDLQPTLFQQFMGELNREEESEEEEEEGEDGSKEAKAAKAAKATKAKAKPAKKKAEAKPLVSSKEGAKDSSDDDKSATKAGDDDDGDDDDSSDSSSDSD